MKGIKIIVMMLLISQAIIAQTKSAKEVTANRIERLQIQVELSADQTAKIESIVMESSTKILALKETGNFDREQIKELKKSERQLIKAELTEEQQATLKDAQKFQKVERKVQKAEHVAKRTKRKAAKTALVQKRAEFDARLTDEEKRTIERSRDLLPERIKGTDAREALSVEEKDERKATRKEISKMLKPIVKKHKTELDTIKAEMPEPTHHKKTSENKAIKANGFYQRFLLIK
ncbi:hypothetical protein N9I68_02660 [Bacteroidia bacterium]|nr:hypothetical protein [Bacteroidia bacterium]